VLDAEAVAVNNVLVISSVTVLVAMMASDGRTYAAVYIMPLLRMCFNNQHSDYLFIHSVTISFTKHAPDTADHQL